MFQGWSKRAGRKAVFLASLASYFTPLPRALFLGQSQGRGAHGDRGGGRTHTLPEWILSYPATVMTLQGTAEERNW